MANMITTGNPFLDALMNAESNGRNIYSGVDKDVSGPNSRSQGYFQINTPTWQQFAGPSKFTNAMSAPFDEQSRVVQNIPLSRFGPRTLRMLHSQFGNFDEKSTAGQLASQFGGATPATTNTGTTLTSTPQTAQTAAAPAAPPTLSPFQQFQQGNIMGGLAGLAKNTQGPGQGGMDNLRPKASEPQGMNVPNLQPHSPNMDMAMAAMQAAQLNQLKPLQNIGGLGGLGGMPDPYGMGGYYG
jgi:hypothetical protein